jgi:hypothetical protein
VTRALLLVVLTAAAGCKSGDYARLIVSLTGSASNIASVDVRATEANRTVDNRLYGPLALPVDVSLFLSASGQVALYVEARDTAGDELAIGQATADVTTGKTSTTSIELVPAAPSPGDMAGLDLQGVVFDMRVPDDLATGTLAFSPSSLDFGRVVVGQKGFNMDLTLRNGGNTASTAITPAALGGAGASQFMLINDGCAAKVLQPVDSCVVSVGFAPTVYGAAVATVVASGTVATLNGSGVTPSALSISPPSINFGAVIIGSMSTPMSFTVTNTGGAESGFLDHTFTGLDAADFASVGSNCSTLAGGASCVINVLFAPMSSGLKSAHLSVAAMPMGGAALADLTGNAQRPATLIAMPSGLDFGSVAVGTTKTQTVDVSNVGDAVSGALSVSVGGSTVFSVLSNTCGAALAATAHCNVTVQFAPTATGTVSTTLTVAGAPGGAAITILSGTGS